MYRSNKFPLIDFGCRGRICQQSSNMTRFQRQLSRKRGEQYAERIVGTFGQVSCLCHWCVTWSICSWKSGYVTVYWCTWMATNWQQTAYSINWLNPHQAHSTLQQIAAATGLYVLACFTEGLAHALVKEDYFLLGGPQTKQEIHQYIPLESHKQSFSNPEIVDDFTNGVRRNTVQEYWDCLRILLSRLLFLLQDCTQYRFHFVVARHLDRLFLIIYSAKIAHSPWKPLPSLWCPIHQMSSTGIPHPNSPFVWWWQQCNQLLCGLKL